MYNKFFGFKEKPFRLVPNPEYLFLSKSHEEALAHLGYAIAHGDGFVEITGEVGTGKTTLCRVFLENLDKSVEAAYIFNPRLDALQLLKAINDEFGIDATPDNTKDLIDRLNTFLIDKKAAGQKVLVVIDEAQNLSLEVLEQLRLLSNLETTREKLLQIILVGQPELGEMLSSHQLRQLGQRITINCRLSPLSFDETRDYIRHRIAMASHRAGPPFDKAAYRAVFEYSRGIPRLINIACDRALLNAFSRNSFQITGSITREAIRELEHRKTPTSARRQLMPVFIALTAVAASLLVFLLYINTTDNAGISAISKTHSSPEPDRIAMESHRPAAPSPADVEPAAPPANRDAEMAANAVAGRKAEPSRQEDPVSPAAAPSAERSHPGRDRPALNNSAVEFLQFLQSLNSRHSRNSAMLQALKLWSPSAEVSGQIMLIDNDLAFFRDAVEKNKLLIQPVATEADLNLLQTLNLPAILTFYLPNHAWPKYLAIAGMDPEKTYLDAGDQGGIMTVDRDVLLRFWSGEAYIVWKNFIGLEGVITEKSPAEAVRTLKELLRDLAYTDDIGSGGFDADIKQLIMDIQTKSGLDADGMVGPLTKMVLYNKSAEFIKPALLRFAAARMENGS